ncbi:MAG: NADPH:quinone oxidoreductase family protein [Acidobacteriota bacterium]|nr:NADPH:quinone oxidoreductase family protein [Acidobacteriota bacterium]
MRAWQVSAWGEPESMSLAEIPVPEPGPNQIRIRNHAAALNFFDILQIQGKYQVKPPFPFTPGAEVAGVVDAVGADVQGFSPGDRVAAIVFGGGMAEYTLSGPSRTFPIPLGMPFDEAAAMPIVYHTTWFALHHRTKIREGEWLLVHAGASGVGMAAIQIGKALGANVIATAGSPEKLAFCSSQGAAHALDYRTPSWVERVKEITGGRGADIVYDPVGGDVFDLSTRCIAPEGRLLVVGFASGRIPSVQANRVLLKNISIIGVLWGNYIDAHPEYPAITHAALAALHRAGGIHPAVSKVYSLDAATEGLRDLANRKVVGKAVIAFDG